MEFKGRRSDEFGLALEAMPLREAPAMLGETVQVAGLSGTVLVTDGSFRDVTVTARFLLADGARIRDIHAWLSGEGLLRFSDEPDLCYEARVLRPFRHGPLLRRMDLRSGSITFSCRPFRVLADPAPEIGLNESGARLFNPGTAPALPRVTVLGDGDFTVTLGGETLAFFGVEEGVVVDSERMDALSLDGSALRNDWISGRPWQLAPGAFTVRWEAGEGGSVQGLRILPRWRWF